MASPLRSVLLGAAISVCSFQMAHACGDKLLALGGGISFQRVFTTRHPGKLILFLPPGSPLLAANADLRIDTALARAGHSVRTVETRAELDQALQEAAADLVVTDWVEARGLDAEVGGRVAILPVSASGDRRVSSSAGCLVDAGKRKGRQIVHAVEQVLVRHGKGLPAGCSQLADAAAS
jgi:hypothetical protein